MRRQKKRQKITVLPGDAPGELKLGWIVREDIGIVVINDYALDRTGEYTEEWENVETDPIILEFGDLVNKRATHCNTIKEYIEAYENHRCEGGIDIVHCNLPKYLKFGFVCRSCRQSWSINLAKVKCEDPIWIERLNSIQTVIA